MPNKPKRFCLNNCRDRAVDGTNYCARCAAAAEDRCCKYKKECDYKRQLREGTAAQRGYDSRWHKVSKLVRRNEPVCRLCKNALAQMVDHIVPLKQGGERLALENLQPICNSCHARKTSGDVLKYKTTNEQHKKGCDL
jgi:5-methylcytosine-specific restriction enzyme A